MKSRLLALLMLIVMLAALVPGAAAQDVAIPCGGLSADDCNVFTTAFTNMAQVTSGTFTMDGFVEILAEDPTMAGKLTINIDGEFNGAPVLSMTGTPANLADATAALGEAGDALKGFSGELNLTLGLPQQAAAMTGGATEIKLELRMVDGVGYINFDSLAESLGAMAQALQLPKGWGGLKLAEGLPGLSSMASGMTSGLEVGGTDSATAAENVAKVQAAAYKYLNVTRDGNTFNMTFDIAGLLADPDIQLAMNSEGDAASTEAIQQAIAGFKDVDMRIAYVLNDANQIGEMNVSFAIPASAFAQMAEDSSEPVPSGMNMEFNMKYADLGTPQTVDAPEGAALTTIDELMSGIFSMMGSMSS